MERKKRNLLSQLYTGKAQSFLSTCLRKCCYEMLDTAPVSFLLTFPNLAYTVHSLAGQRSRELELKLCLRCTWHFFIFKSLRKVSFSVLSAGTKSRGKMSRAKNKWNEPRVRTILCISARFQLRETSRGPNLLLSHTQWSNRCKHMPQSQVVVKCCQIRCRGSFELVCIGQIRKINQGARV